MFTRLRVAIIDLHIRHLKAEIARSLEEELDMQAAASQNTALVFEVYVNALRKKIAELRGRRQLLLTRPKKD